MEEIITRYFQNNITAKEQSLLDDWLAEGDVNRKEFEALKKTWELTSRLISIRSVNIEKAKKAVKKNIPEFKKSKSILYYWQRIAAVIFLPFLLAVTFVIYMYFRDSSEKITQQEISAACGTRTRFNLPDGTEVWLNSGSKIKFPSRFIGAKREVSLEGEAFFDVSKDKLRPFYVNLGAMSVKAVGTSFNISAYKKDNSYETTLISGELLLIKKDIGRHDIILFKMEPNQHTIFNKKDKNIKLTENIVPGEPLQSENIKGKSVDLQAIKQKDDNFENKYTSWINGKLIFRDDPMDEVIKRLGRWYNVDIQLKDTLLYGFRYTATFIDETLEQVLDLLKLSAPIEYTLTERKVNNDNSFSKKFVVIKLKRKK